MPVPLKLAAFAAGLAVVFAAAFGVGALADDGDAAPAPAPHSGMR